MHVAEAKRMTGTAIPWLADGMDDRMTNAFGKMHNGEFVIDPDGVVVRQRFWSNPMTLRSDLEELVGPVDTPTRIEDLPVKFRAEPREIASGVVPRIELPKGLSPIVVEHIAPEERPVYVKLRAEMTEKPDEDGKQKIYLGFYMDPIHRVHWNNGAGPVNVEIQAPDGSGVESANLVGPEVDEAADVDARMFLIDAEKTEGEPESINVKLRYLVCDDAETFCVPMTQEYEVTLQPLKNKSTRPGIFLDEIFSDVAKYDKDGDGLITPEEFGEGNVTKYMTHIDYNLDNVIDEEELARFNSMYNNGRGIGTVLVTPEPGTASKSDSAAPATASLTPDEVVERFFKGMVEGDREKSASAIVVNDAALAYIDANILQLQAFENFARTDAEFFGEGGIPVDALAKGILQNLDTVVVEMVDETHAIWPLKKNNPLELLKTDDGWKVDLGGPKQAEFLNLAVSVMTDAARVWDETREMISDGRIDSRNAVRKEVARLKEKYGL